MDPSVVAYKSVLKQIILHCDQSEMVHKILNEDVFICSLLAYKEELFNHIVTTTNVKESSIRLLKPHNKVYETLFNLSILSLRYMSVLKPRDHQEIIQENLALFIRKNQDYGDSFQDFQMIGIIVRLNDKINRLLTLMRNKTLQVKDEAIEDTMNDLYNYGILALMYKEK